MKKYIIIFCSAFLVSGALPVSAALDYPQTYKFYMELGKAAMEQGDYREAYTHFRHAQAVGPGEKEPALYINLIKRLEDKRVEPKPAAEVIRPSKKSRDQIISEALDRYTPMPPQRRCETAGPATTEPAREVVWEPLKQTAGKAPNVVYLDDNLWRTQPGTLVRVELRASAVLEGRNIQRHLIITPGFIEAERLDKDRINITAERRGSTLVHVWDDTGRWTFNVEVVLPVRRAAVKVVGKQSERYVEPFKISYSADWSSFYAGPTFKKAERENLNYLQQILLEGETPYGGFDSHAVINKFDESTEVTGYGIGLTDGKIGDFKDFTIRGFDIQKVFSPLSLPGQYMRGVLFEAKAFDKNIEYAYIRGRDRAVFGFLAPEVLEKRESFIEGARLTLFPEKENRYSVNFARGYGEAREFFLKERVVSVEGRHRLSDLLLSGEFAYDESAGALTLGSRYEKGDHDLTVNFRNVEKDFTTITSLPGNRGEVGSSIFWNWRLGGIDINTHLDLYRERFLPNPQEEGALNVDFSTAVDVPLSTADRFLTSLYYVDTTGELSPRNNVRLNATYTRRLPLGRRDITAFVGATQQRSRFDLSPASEFDRYSVSTGFTIPLVQRLNYYANYEYSWVYEEQSGGRLTPNVFNTGLNYSKRLTDGWSVHSSFSYRNEENTEGTNSFLAGEDNITGSIGTVFRPHEDFEFFLDGRVRNVWAEEADRAAFNEIDVRAGVRTSWDLPFRWNPEGTVAGFVYKDVNGNQRRDNGETGIAGVSVKVGKSTVVTDSKGYYRSTVKAKSVEVTVDIDSIPDGFVFSGPMTADVGIIPHKIQKADFGLTAQSGVYGIVFYDKNGNDRPDAGDDFMAKARIILDGERVTVSDFEGTYFFEDVEPGRHHIGIDVNSLPIEYLPKIKLTNEIEVSEGTTYIFHVPLNKTVQR